jgi:hypothetical protein
MKYGMLVQKCYVVYVLFEEVHMCHKDSDVAVNEVRRLVERFIGKHEKDPTAMENIAVV